MPNPRLPEDVIQAIKAQWGIDPKQRAKEVHAEIEALGHRVSLRKVQQVIAELKRRGAGDIEVELWRPWEDPTETPQETIDLIRVAFYWKRWCKRELYRHEAKWARRLKQALPTTSDRYLTMLTLLYAERELVAMNLNEPTITSDLDPLLLFTPWVSSEHWQLYDKGIGNGALEEPKLTEVVGVESGAGDRQTFVKGLDALLLLFSVAKHDREALGVRDRHQWWTVDYAKLIADAERNDVLDQLSEDDVDAMMDYVSGDTMNQSGRFHVERKHPTTQQD